MQRWTLADGEVNKLGHSTFRETIRPSASGCQEIARLLPILSKNWEVSRADGRGKYQEERIKLDREEMPWDGRVSGDAADWKHWKADGQTFLPSNLLVSPLFSRHFPPHDESFSGRAYFRISTLPLPPPPSRHSAIIVRLIGPRENRGGGWLTTSGREIVSLPIYC